MPDRSREERLAAAFVDLAGTLVRDFDVINFLHTLTDHSVDLLEVSAAAGLLRLHDQVIGALNLFRNQPGPLDASQLRLGQALADTATIGILQQRAVSEQMTVTAQLQATLDSWIVIEQAKGCLAQLRDTGV